MLHEAIAQFLADYDLAPTHVIAACSGGIDSTAMLLALRDVLPHDSLTAAHVNHHLRGAESDGDESFLRELCERLGIPLRVVDGTLDADAIKQHGVEAAAREMRHKRLHEIRTETGASHIATAHQKNDQAETVVMRLITGSGLAGLRGIHPVRDDGVIRPLLEVTRGETEAFLQERNVNARIDSSNADARFLRNRLRTILREFEAAAIDNLASAAGEARTQWQLITRLIDEAESTVTTDDETVFLSLPTDPWMRQAVIHRHIVRLAPDEAREVSAADLRRLAAGTGTVARVSVTKTLELMRRGDELVLRRLPEKVPEFELRLSPGNSAIHVDAIGKTLRIAKGVSGRGQRFQLPSGETARFTIRNRRAGDRFQPLGMVADKKLKDFLIDRKIAVELRDRIPLLVWNGAIVWIAGVEVSERFKVTDAPGERYEVWLEDEGQESVQR